MMHRVLAVANQTLSGQELTDVIKSRLEERPCEFWLPVPAPRSDPPHQHPTFRLSVGAEIPMDVPEPSDAAAYEAAQRGLQAGVERLRHLGAISTLPAGSSRWLHRDLPRRVERKFKLPVVTARAAVER